MNIKKIFSEVEYKVLQCVNKEILSKNIEYDSRKINEGDIFVALEGSIVDGHDYIEKAIELGAKTIIVSKEVPMKENINYFLVDNLRTKLPFIASNFYDYPQDQ
ncbi:MAG: Mur ligase domain-containing protein, partial [Fusobacterium sp.]